MMVGRPDSSTSTVWKSEVAKEGLGVMAPKLKPVERPCGARQSHWGTCASSKNFDGAAVVMASAGKSR